MDIFIQNTTGKTLPQDTEQIIEKVIFSTLNSEKIKNDIEVSITIVSNDEIRKLNKDFRKIDKATDVLSFPLYERAQIKNISEKDMLVLGDIVISLEKAEQQSTEYGHSLFRELGFLVAHSMLHLLGHDHITKHEESIMIDKQNTILNNVGLYR